MEMVLRLPKNYVEVADDEMEYVEGAIGIVAICVIALVVVVVAVCLFIGGMHVAKYLA